MSKIHVNDIVKDLNLFSINKGEILYNDKSLAIQTDWYKMYSNYGKIRIPIDTDDNIYKVIDFVDNYVRTDDNITGLHFMVNIKKAVNKFNNNYLKVDKFGYAVIIDENKNVIKGEDFVRLIENPKVGMECRLIFNFNKIKCYKGYYGTKINVLTLQYRMCNKKEIEKVEFSFD